METGSFTDRPTEVNNDAQYPRLLARFLSVFTEGGRPSDSAADHFIWFPDARNLVFRVTGITFSVGGYFGGREDANRAAMKQRLDELEAFLDERQEPVTDYDEGMVRRLIERITVFEDHLEFEFKCGLETEVQM